MMKQEITLSPQPATINAELQQMVQDAWDKLTQDDIRHLHDRLHAKIHACVAARGSIHSVLLLLFGHPLL